MFSLFCNILYFYFLYKSRKFAMLNAFVTHSLTSIIITPHPPSNIQHSHRSPQSTQRSQSIATHWSYTPKMAHRIPSELQSLPNLRNQRQLALAREQREETSRARQVDAQRALQKEMIKLQKEPLEGIRINLDDENILKWTAVIFGPPDTPYQGGYFKASLDFSCHPFWPPVIRFTPPIHHPNIHRENGILCYQLVRPPAQGSSGSTWNVRNLLLSFLALLVDPNPDDPANHEAAMQYRHYKEEGDPAYLNAINANVAESRELAKRDNVIVPETNEDYTRSGIPTEQQQQSNPAGTEANVQEEEEQDDIAYPEDEDEGTNYDDDNEGNLFQNLANNIINDVDAGNLFQSLANILILAAIEENQHQHDDGEEDGGLMTAVGLGDAETANSNTEDALYEEENGDTEDEQQQPEATGPTIATQASASISSVYLHDVPRPEPIIATQASASISSVYLHDVPRPEPTIATQASASISSVYLHDVPRPEPTIATQASASISSVYLHDVPRPEPTIATQASASISSVYLHDVPRPEPTIANRQLSNDSVYL